MRFLIKVRMPTEAGNHALESPDFVKNLEAGVKAMNAEAFYGCEMDGDRTAIIIASFDTPDKIPAIAEPFFHLGFQVSMHPAMVMDDLKRGVAGWKAMAKR
ncbi:MAG: hypothetical protein WAN74_06320 [Thermoplasmata archaeon]